MNQKASWGVLPPSTLGVSKETMDIMLKDMREDVESEIARRLIK